MTVDIMEDAETVQETLVNNQKEQEDEDTKLKEDSQFAKLKRLLPPCQENKSSQLDILLETINYINLLNSRLTEQR